MSEVDPFGKLLDVIDRRARTFGPDQTALMGVYDYSDELSANAVTLDDGRVIPNPVTTSGVGLGQRVLVVLMQGGHDVCVMAVQT